MWTDHFRIGAQWPGWATVESEPAIFELLLKKIGVKDISVEEVYSLNSDSLRTIEPIHGLIFLFRWREEQDSAAPELICPTDIWFANQVMDNACASLALLNIVFNIEGADIGAHLLAFKEFSADFSPPLKGLTLTNFDHLRTAHNTFARKSDMTGADLGLMQAMKARGRQSQPEEDDTEDCFHFIAYIYKRGHLWELDGLKKAPVRLNKCGKDNWTSFAAPQIQERMERYAADEIRFNLLALCQDPAVNLQERLHDREADLELEAAEDQATPLVNMLTEEVRAIKQQLEGRRQREEDHKVFAERRRHDYGHFSKRMLELLNDKGVLQEMLHRTD